MWIFFSLLFIRLPFFLLSFPFFYKFHMYIFASSWSYGVFVWHLIDGTLVIPLPIYTLGFLRTSM